MKMNMKNIIKSSILGGSVLAVSVNAATLGEVNGTTVTAGGYVKLDAMFTDYADGEISANSWLRDFHVPSTIPVGGEPQNMTFDMHARQTRFNLGTSTKIDDHVLSTFIELDFMTHNDGNERVSNSYSPRLRHAFIKYENWLLGQTWSTFQNLGALPETADFIGNTEFGIFARQAQVRYTHGPWQFAIENPESTVTVNGGRVVTDDNELPDFVGRYNFSDGDLSLSAAVLARQITINNGGDVDESTTSVGLSLSGKYMFGRDDLRFGVNTGSGMGRYIGLNFANGATLVNEARIDHDDDPETAEIIDTTEEASYSLDTVDSTAFYVGYRHFWNEKLRSSLTFSMIDVDNDSSALYDATDNDSSLTKSATSIRLNVFYSPLQHFTVGAEVAMSSLERESLGRNDDNDITNASSTSDGDMTRLQFIAKLAF